MSRVRHLVATVAVLALATRAGAQAPDVRARLDTLVPASLARHGVPSLAIARLERGRVAWTRTWGEAAPGVRADSTTLYNVASLTKPVFAEVVHRLVAAGKLDLDAPMAATWRDPGLDPDADLARLTLRQALGHRIGFANWRRESGGVLRMVYPPDTIAHYSGEGYLYALRYVERQLGRPMDAIAREVLFTPAGARDIAFTRQPWFGARLAQGRDEGGAWRPGVTVDSANGADDLITTIGAYAAVAASMLRGDALDARARRARDAIQAIDPGMTGACASKSPSPCPWRNGLALGWAVMEVPGDAMQWHTGSDAAERSMVLLFPATGDGWVFLSNGANGFEPVVDVLVAVGAAHAGMRALVSVAR